MNPETSKKIKELLEEIEELKDTNEERQSNFDSYKEETKEIIEELKDEIKTHDHDGSNTSKVTGAPKIKTTEPVFVGNSGFMNLTNLNTDGAGQKRYVYTMWAGNNENVFSSSNAQIDKNSFLYFDNFQGANTNLSATAYPTFLNQGNQLSITAAQTVITDDTFGWTTSELVNTYVFIQTSGGSVMRKITANTSTTFTMASSTGLTGSYIYAIYKPVLLGSSTFPWRRLYVLDGDANGIRFGRGATGTGENSLLYADESTGDLSYKNFAGSDKNIAATTATPLSGTKTYYVADSSGGATTRKLTFNDGILTSET